jgi:hypothetical protein
MLLLLFIFALQMGKLHFSIMTLEEATPPPPPKKRATMQATEVGGTRVPLNVG